MWALVAAHRKARQRSIGGNTARTAITIALAGAATATGFDGVGHADPQLSPAQVKARVDKLYEEAEAATQKYDGAKEKAGQAEARLGKLRDEAARREDRLNTARASGHVLRYVGVINNDGSMSAGLRTYPLDHPFASLQGSDNIVSFQTVRYNTQPMIVRGPGAGPEVTAAGVFADLLRLASFLGAPQ